jgi:hypothetical protein
MDPVERAVHEVLQPYLHSSLDDLAPEVRQAAREGRSASGIPTVTFGPSAAGGRSGAGCR